MSIAICHAGVAAPSLWTATSALKPLLQESTTENCACRPGEGVGVGGGGGTGGASSSTMVAVPVARVMVAPVALVSTTVKCSLGSLSWSGVMAIEIVLLSSPGAKVTEPLLARKSALVASTATVWKSTVTLSVAGLESVRTNVAAGPVPLPVP